MDGSMVDMISSPLLATFEADISSFPLLSSLTPPAEKPASLSAGMTHEQWRSLQPFWVQWLDRFVLTPWVHGHQLPVVSLIPAPSPASKADPEVLSYVSPASPDGFFYGNTLVKKWKARSSYTMFLALLVLTSPLLTSLLSSPQLSGQAMMNTPWWNVYQWFRCYLFTAGLSNAAFAFTAYVTTCRPSPFLSAHGTYRDLLVINLAAPVLSTLMVYPQAAHMFHWHAGAAWTFFSPEFCVITGIFVGLHITYIVRSGFCDKSISAVEVAGASGWALAGIIFRLALIGGFIMEHIRWVVDSGALWYRLPLYIGMFATLTIINNAVTERYYFHWHHWAAALMLSPAACTHSTTLSLLLAGVVIGQHVDGAARWSCAPLWHRKEPHGLGKSLI
jgi:hypothetical protein